MKLGEVGTAIATVKFYLAQDLGIIKFLAETAVAVLDKAGCKNNPIRSFEKFFFITAFRAAYSLSAGKSYHFRPCFFFLDFGRI
jgi:hypothetical protein